jgi:hypothetical protein
MCVHRGSIGYAEGPVQRKLLTEFVNVVRDELSSIISVPPDRLTVLQVGIIHSEEVGHSSFHFVARLGAEHVCTEVISAAIDDVKHVTIASNGLRERAAQIATEAFAKVSVRVAKVFRKGFALCTASIA